MNQEVLLLIVLLLIELVALVDTTGHHLSFRVRVCVREGEGRPFSVGVTYPRWQLREHLIQEGEFWAPNLNPSATPTPPFSLSKQNNGTQGHTTGGTSWAG